MQFDCIRWLKICFSCMLYITVKTCNRKDAVKHFFYQNLFNIYCFNFQVQERELYYILWRLWHSTEFYSNFKSNIHFLSCSALFKRDFLMGKRSKYSKSKSKQ